MALNTIEQEWQRFARMVFQNTQPSETQTQEMRKAFYAGAHTILTAAQEIGEPHIPEQMAIQYFEARLKETNEFHKQLLREYGETN